MTYKIFTKIKSMASSMKTDNKSHIKQNIHRLKNLLINKSIAIATDNGNNFNRCKFQVGDCLQQDRNTDEVSILSNKYEPIANKYKNREKKMLSLHG